MSFLPGARLGPYEVIAPIGAGGMGEVFKARDTRLDRSVAIKVLPAEFSNNAQLRVRFEREAKTISQLNHPNICTLFDVGEGYLVMELLEGESLADRVERGPLPIPEVLRLGAQIADALDRAHRAGIVHRDLKPGNVFITRSGAKLLDFGLAKSDPQAAAFDAATQQKPLTQEGTILGTFQYMAPEQLEGLEADARTDIFAFGAVLYEMATGKRAFDASSRTSLIAAIVSAEPPPISAIQPLTPPALEHVVKKCLSKDRDARWQSAHDIAEELRWISEAGSQAGVASPLVAAQRFRQRVRWIATIVAVAAIAAGAAWFAAARKTLRDERSEIYRLTLPTPPGSILGYAAGRMALSPDGRTLTYASFGRDGNVLMVRKLSETSWRILNGTVGASSPFWSADSKQIGYFARGSIWKIAADGASAPEEIAKTFAATPLVPIASWNPDGTILFSIGVGLYRVSGAGGEPVEILPFGKKMPITSVLWLPDGRHFICGVLSGKVIDQYVASLDAKEPPAKLTSGDTAGTIAGDYLLFANDSTLYAQPFNTRKLKLEGERRAIAKIQMFENEAAYFTAAGDTLVYLPLGSEVRTQLQRVDRSGKQLAMFGYAFFFSPRISHDGKRIAVDSSATTGPGDIWMIDTATNAGTRLTFDPANESAPIWGPTDSDLIYFRNAPEKAILMRKQIAGGQPSIALKIEHETFSGDWSRDGKWYAAQTTPTLGAAVDAIYVFALPEWKKVAQIAGVAPRFSPDARFIAYAVQENSRASEVYVEPFPPNGSKWQVSVDGGAMPVWRPDGKALFFVDSAGKLAESAISIGADGSFSAQPPQPLFSVGLREGVQEWQQYDVFPDGTFLLNRIPDDATTPMTVVLHWKEALRE
jgi:Tol biopolymer transport system component